MWELCVSEMTNPKKEKQMLLEWTTLVEFSLFYSLDLLSLSSLQFMNLFGTRGNLPKIPGWVSCQIRILTHFNQKHS